MKRRTHFQQLSDAYGIPAKRGARVRYSFGLDGPRIGTVVSSDGQYIRIRFESNPDRIEGPFHPTWEMTWLDEETPSATKP